MLGNFHILYSAFLPCFMWTSGDRLHPWCFLPQKRETQHWNDENIINNVWSESDVSRVLRRLIDIQAVVCSGVRWFFILHCHIIVVTVIFEYLLCFEWYAWEFHAIYCYLFPRQGHYFLILQIYIFHVNMLGVHDTWRGINWYISLIPTSVIWLFYSPNIWHDFGSYL